MIAEKIQAAFSAEFRKNKKAKRDEKEAMVSSALGEGAMTHRPSGAAALEGAGVALMRVA